MASDAERIAALEGKLAAIRELVDTQAEDDGIWFIAETVTEAHLQQELRKLHALIEAQS